MDATSNYNFFDDIITIDIEEHNKDYFKLNIELLKSSYKNDNENILILNNNITTSPSYSVNNLINAITFMEENKEWDIVYLGYSDISYILNSEKINENIIKYKSKGTYAICYNKRGIEKILEDNLYEDAIEDGVSYEDYLTNYMNLESYCFLPILFLPNNNIYNKINHNLSIINYKINNIDYDLILLILSISLFVYIKYNINIYLNYSKKDLINRYLLSDSLILKQLIMFL